jgi:hypothetical protein
MAKTWAAVAESPEFKALSSDAQETARNQYFRDIVAPQVPTDQLDAVKTKFDSDTKPSILGRVASAFRAASNEAQQAPEAQPAPGLDAAPAQAPVTPDPDLKGSVMQRGAPSVAPVAGLNDVAANITGYRAPAVPDLDAAGGFANASQQLNKAKANATAQGRATALERAGAAPQTASNIMAGEKASGTISAPGSVQNSPFDLTRPRSSRVRAHSRRAPPRAPYSCRSNRSGSAVSRPKSRATRDSPKTCATKARA